MSMNKYVYGISAHIECLGGDLVVRTNPETKILLGRRLKIGWWLMKLGMKIAAEECDVMNEEIQEEHVERKETRMPEGLTKMGYDMIVEHIINRKIQPSEEMYTMELSAWLTGYTKCQNDIIDIINKLKDQYGR